MYVGGCGSVHGWVNVRTCMWGCDGECAYVGGWERMDIHV